MTTRVPTALQFLEGEKTRKAAAIREMADAAEKEGRGPSPEEQEFVEKAFKDIAEYDAQLANFRDAEKLRESIDKLTVETTPAEVTGKTRRAYRSAGEMIVDSDGFKAIIERKKAGALGRFDSSGTSIEVPRWLAMKAAITDDDGAAVLAEGSDVAGNITSGLGGALPQPQVLPGIQAPGFQRLTIADLMASGQTTTNTVRYLVESASANNAASVHEAAAKPASSVTFEARNEPVVKIATFLPTSEEMLEDVAQIRSYLDTRLRQFVQIEEEDQLLNASGSGDDLDGLLNRVTQTVDATDYDNLFDAIAAAFVEVRVNGFDEPDAIVINPHDSFDLDTLKSVAGTGGYFSGGPYSQASNTPWGVRMVRTTAIAAGHVLVGAFRNQAQVFRRGGLTVDASNSHEDYFRRNLVAIRAEERLALAVYRPAAFCEIVNAS